LIAECTTCQATLDDDARFCSQCGAAAPSSTPVEGDALRTALERKLVGHYRIIRLLGSGGMGSVYLARDLTLDREVAVKVVKTASDRREIYDRLRREARTSAKLSHPNIVPLHAFGEVEGMPYFVMGYVRGESLAARLRREGRLSETDARRIVAGIADALDHAHRQGIVHRDIKPDNVLIDDESGRALLTDFGVAKAFGGGDSMTGAGIVIGTPQYMSPEQASGNAGLDGRSDIYSLGVMAYAMLAGRLPFDGSSVSDILSKHLTQEAPPLRSIVPSLSDSTVQIVERCLFKDPARRWPDARSLKLAIGTDTDSHHLPDALHEIEGQGIIFIVVAAALLAALIPTHPPTGVYFINAGALTAIYVAVLARLRFQGFPIRETQRALWAQPLWWRFWYPRSLRLPNSVWDRLPASVRRMRTLPPLLLPCVLSLFAGPFPNAFRHPVAFWLKIGVFAVFAAVWDVFMLLAQRYLRRRGIRGVESRRMMMSERLAGSPFWLRPNIAAVLEAPKPAAARSETPYDDLQSILQSAAELSAPLRPLGAEAAAAARQLIESIDEVDREIATLARNVEPGEEERLAGKIGALTDDESAPLRSLLEKQLELIQDLSARIGEANATRNRRVEILRTLALQIASLRARSAEPSEVRSLSDRVRVLCDQIARQADREDDVPTAIQ
jgi:hypothetical protein